MAKKNDTLHRTKIGGQALIEGIMMRGVGRAAMAVRKKDGSIEVEEWDIKSGKWYQKCPFIRGSFNFVLQMMDGYKYMTKSAEMSGMLDDEEGEEMTKFEKWLTDKLGDKLTDVIMGIAIVIAIVLMIGMFFLLPTWIFDGIQYLCSGTDITAYRSLVEGILKMALFVLYLWITSKSKDIRRTYEYHGAEHKTIFCYESGKELTVENVKGFKRFHPRCGTSFVFLTLAISILVYSIVPINNEMFIQWFGVDNLIAGFIRVACKLLLLPVIVGISYEMIKIAGRYDNIVTKIISAPGLALQRLTTKEPDASQIEVAIAAIKPVLPEDKESDKW